MPESALTIASLLVDPALQEACGQWLKGGRYRVVPMALGSEAAVDLDWLREDVDAVLLQQGAAAQLTFRQWAEQGLLLPAVVIGEVSGHIDYHDAEVHLPADQLEQLSYSIDAALVRLLRRGLQGAGSTTAGASGSGGAVEMTEGW